ncbi:MAG: hypothetical protein K0S48_1089 [Ramlibacter sp.]|jgi:hypothetical protein|nr:hypothetical protein [Ramlibacter sp.]
MRCKGNAATLRDGRVAEREREKDVVGAAACRTRLAARQRPDSTLETTQRPAMRAAFTFT